MSDMKSTKAVVATGTMNDIILERFLINKLPNPRQFCLKGLYKYTGYKYYSLRQYVHSNLFTVGRRTIDITADNQLLSRKAKEYAERLIKKIVCPSKYEKGCYEYDLGKFIDNSYFTEEEKEFINLMLNELLLIASITEFPHQISARDLFDFNSLNHNSFYHSAKKVYNDILQKRLNAGDNILEYLKADLSENEIAERLEKSCKFDYFFDKDGTLKCDLYINRNILIKNFINTVLYSFRDHSSRFMLLLKLNSKYPFLICEKI